MLSAGLDEAARRAWADRLDRAAEAVAASGLISAATGWNGELLVEIPADDSAFAAASGLPDGDAAAGTKCDHGTPRIVVNPAVLELDPGYLDVLLVHEAVHVASDSPCSQAGLGWVVEGLAESVAAGTDAELAQANAGLVRDHVREHGVPDDLPAVVSDQTDYALAQLAVDQVREHLDLAEAADFFDRAIRNSGSVTAAELTEARAWYLAELARIARAA